MTLLLSGGSSSFITMNGVITAVAVLTMIAGAYYHTIKHHGKESTLTYITPMAILAGLVGARILYVSVMDQLYVEESDKWRLTDGGYSLFGAAAGVVLVVVCFCFITKRKREILPVLDSMSFAAPLAIAVGRMGSVFSESCLGESVEDPGLCFFPISIYSESENGYCLAVFFYEAVYCLLVFAAVVYADSKIEKKGICSYLFAAMYCGGRSFFESMRTDSMYVAFVRLSQVLALFVLMGVLIYLSIKLVKMKLYKRRWVVFAVSWTVFLAALAVAFYSEFYMYSNSKLDGTLRIGACCLIMTVTAISNGYFYLVAKQKTLQQKSHPYLEDDEEWE